MSLRAGIIGAGWVGSVHANVLKTLPDAELVAVSDLDEAKAKKAVEGVDAKPYTDYVKMLSAERLDVVFVCVPPHLHGEIEFAAAEHARGVFIEKPVGNSMEKCLKVQEAFEKAGTIAGAAYMNRYRRQSERAKELLSDPNDPPVMAIGWWIGGMPGAAWWRNKAESGGQMNEQCTHVIDLARWLVGEVAEVFAYGAKGFVTEHEDCTVEDAVFANLKFASGAVGNISTGCFEKPGHASGMGVGLTVASRAVKCIFSGWGMDLVATIDKDSTETIPQEGDVFEAEDRAFLRAVETNDPSLIRTSYEDALKTLALALAVNESMETGKPVKLC
jgi:predicted dehydrogenase